VTLTVTDQRGQSVAPTAPFTVIPVAPVVNVGSANAISSGPVFSHTFSFTAPNAGSSVSVDYGDGTTETFDLTAGNHQFNPSTNSFTLQHQYGTNDTFTVTVTVTDRDGVSGSAQLSVTVFDQAEFARIIAFAMAYADSTGSANVGLSSPDGTVTLDGTLTGAVPETSLLALTVFNGNPEPDNYPSQTGGGNLLPIDAGSSKVNTATPLDFIDTRAEAPGTALVDETYQFILPTSLIHGAVKVYWFNQDLGIWESVNGQSAGNGTVKVTPILDASGNPTGLSLITFSESFGPGSSPDTGHLGGTVFSIAIPVGNVGSTQTVVFPALLAGPTTGVSVLTTGFSSGSNLTLSLQESQSGLLLAGLVGTHIPGDAPGEVDDGVPAGGDDQLLSWLTNGWLWGDRRQTRAGTDQPPPPPASNNQQAQPPATSQQPGSVPPEKDDQAVDILFSTETEFQLQTHPPLPQLPTLDALPVLESSGTQPPLALGVVLAGAALPRPKQNKRRLGFTRLR
jgi:hypothetical protein